MNKLQYAIAVAILPLTVAATALTTVSAATAPSSAASCTVKALGTKDTAGNADSRFTINSDGTVSAQVVVSGDASCEVPVTMASWQAPDAQKGRPYNEQTLFAHTTETFGVGTHPISVALPDCFFQVDLLRSASPTAADGSPVYPADALMGSLHGGSQACTPVTPPTPPVTPPSTPVPPTPPATLVNTGAGNFLGLGVGTTILGYAAYLVNLKRRANA